MNKLTKTLLGGAALSSLIVAPAVAGRAPKFHIQALHAGKAVNKTKVHNYDRTHLTYTFGVSTYISPSDFHKIMKLTNTFYRWLTYTSCLGYNTGKDRIKVPKKSMYGRVGAATTSYSFCGFGPTIFFGDSYKLVDTAGEGKTDHFVSILYGKFENSRGKYKGTLNLDVSVTIGIE